MTDGPGRKAEPTSRKAPISAVVLTLDEEAAIAIRTLVELEPESFHTRLEVATELARHGLDDAAALEFTAAEELAGWLEAR